MFQIVLVKSNLDLPLLLPPIYACKCHDYFGQHQNKNFYYQPAYGDHQVSHL